jgi:hypothetical protein
MSAPSITVLNCINGEVQWNAPIYDIDAVAQIIDQRLLLFQGEWWASLTDGLPLWQSIVGQSASGAALAQIEILIGARISETPFVIGLSNVATTYNPQTRAYTYSAQVQTAFGTIPIASYPVANPGGVQ